MCFHYNLRHSKCCAVVNGYGLEGPDAPMLPLQTSVGLSYRLLFSLSISVTSIRQLILAHATDASCH